MHNKILDELVQEVKKGNNTSYLLRKDDTFYDIGFRIMKNQGDGCLLDCHRLKYNGSVKLVYFTDHLITLRQIFLESNVNMITIVVINLLNAIESVVNNGFLNVACIDNDIDKVYIEKNTLAIKLIYLPLNIPISGTTRENFETELRANLVKLLQNMPLAENAEIKKIKNIVTDAMIPFSELAKHIREVLNDGDNYITSQFVLEQINGRLSITIAKDEFIVGKSAERVDGIIEGNRAISRVHCKFTISDGKLFVKDMNSANGTFVSGKRLQPDINVEIQVGTIIKLADMEFIIRR